MANRTSAHIIRLASVSVLISVLWAALVPMAWATSEEEKPLALLVDLIRLENRASPLYPIGNFESSPDPSVHAANMEYIQNNVKLREKIRSDLGEQPFQWRLKSLFSRLLYVPENRPEYISLYEAYCHIVIREILAKTQFPNPYSCIVTLSDRPPPPSSNGICAYIVHNLTTEIRAEYEFRNASKQAVVIELSTRFVTGEVGSYSSFLTVDADGGVGFTRDPFTIWQNSAQNPYTALMTPVEETLHVALRESTQTAIKAAIENRGIRSAREAKGIVAEWISVEEAIVGALVYHLLPPILEKQVGVEPLAFINKDIETKSGFAKYRHLKRGIRLVRDMGYRTAIRLYQDNPVAFRSLLYANQPAPTAGDRAGECLHDNPGKTTG